MLNLCGYGKWGINHQTFGVRLKTQLHLVIIIVTNILWDYVYANDFYSNFQITTNVE